MTRIPCSFAADGCDLLFCGPDCVVAVVSQGAGCAHPFVLYLDWHDAGCHPLLVDAADALGLASWEQLATHFLPGLYEYLSLPPRLCLRRRQDRWRADDAAHADGNAVNRLLVAALFGRTALPVAMGGWAAGPLKRIAGNSTAATGALATTLAQLDKGVDGFWGFV